MKVWEHVFLEVVGAVVFGGEEVTGPSVVAPGSEGLPDDSTEFTGD
jgi:hypothetical protein